MRSEQFIHTKLQRPHLSHDLIARPHLFHRLDQGKDRKLTLIAAPAGYGKSVLVSSWSQSCSCPVGWLTLDKNDNDLRTFLSYLVRAIHTVYPDACGNMALLLDGAQMPPLDVWISTLVNDTNDLPNSFHLVLDDYHLIQNSAIHEVIDSLIRYKDQGAGLHLVLITRQDPPLNVINLRAKSEVTDIRLADLRFDEAEVQRFLQVTLGDTLTDELAQQLFARVEGWPAGLRLASLALRNQKDPINLLESHHGAYRYLMSYFLREVLSQQPPGIRAFLLRTSLLERFNAPLCDAVMADEDQDRQLGSEEILTRLYQDNLFLTPLDHQGVWFRYHQLFRDLLSHQLRTTVTESEVSECHRRASHWLAQHGFIEEAIDHAFAAQDEELAVQIVARERYRLLNEAQWQRLAKLLTHFRRDSIDSSPDLFMADTWLHYHHTQFTKLPSDLAHLELLITENDSLTADQKEHFWGEISALQSLLAYFAVDTASVIQGADRALELTAPELWIVRVLARQTKGAAQQMEGRLTEAYATMYRGFDQESTATDAFRATLLATVCAIDWMAADLVGLRQHAAQVIELSQNAKSPEMANNGHYHLGTVAYLHNELEAAEEHLALVYQRPYAAYGSSFAYSACGLALTYQALSRAQEALDVVETALAFLLSTGNAPLLRMMEAFQAEIALRQGHLSVASRWAEQLEPIPSLIPIYNTYAPHLTLVKVWLAENTAAAKQKAASLLAQLQTFFEATHNAAFLMDTLALRAILHEMQGDEQTALLMLQQALGLGNPGKFIRNFVDLGPILGDLLPRLTSLEPEIATYREQILSAMPARQQHGDLRSENGDSQPIVEALTSRELEVLFLLNQRRTDREIAAELHISPHTVRSHTKNIYRKLGVNSRREAAHRAGELGLLV